ncbi:MAG TPA: peptidoglycan-binding protein [Acidimicrobiales bacterium]|nr:peptidoglycan-binding protein [Acidimicrobiales bacterium]
MGLSVSLAGGAAAGALVTAAPAGAASTSNRLLSGTTLASGHSIVSASGQFRLVMETGGDLVVLHGSTPIWGITGRNDPGAHAIMQSNGDFVLYNGSHVVWTTGTDRAGDAGSNMRIDDNGELEIKTPSGHAIWTSYPKPTLGSGMTLLGGSVMLSANGQYKLAMERGGDLALYHGAALIWHISPRDGAGDQLSMNRGGDLVLTKGARLLWHSGTDKPGDGGSTLNLENSGDLAVLTPGNTQIWGTVPDEPTVSEGDTGAAVALLQRDLTALGYWVDTTGGTFDDSTQQAVWALQKAAGLDRDGVVGPTTWEALFRGVQPAIRAASGNLIEVNLSDDLLMIIVNGKLWRILNCSTGGGYTYVENGQTDVAITPTGVFSTFAAINGTDTDPLGTLWRPRFFYEGYAIHGDSDVPPYPVSHGCVRISDEAINWIWAVNADPIGEEVWVYS